jgi:Icc-related predicted phosphoesterase
MRVVLLSDTHNRHAELQVPDGDLLLHAGDFTMRGTEREIGAFDEWLSSLPHRDKVVIAGNHDFLFEREPRSARSLIRHAEYLQDSGITVSGLAIWGSPWQPWFMDWAFNLQRGEPLRAVWDGIPAGTSILLTHGPPHGILDATARGEHVGCEELLAAALRVRPRFHAFGHIHEGYGREARDATTFVNAASCDERYRVVNAPVVLEIDIDG